MKYGAIKDNADRFSIRLMCAALQVSASGYYEWLERPESERSAANREMLERIRRSHERSRGSYGSPRVLQDLRAEGYHLGKNRVARLMRADGLRAHARRKWRATTQSAHRLPVADNTLNRAFDVDQADRVWAGDITYIWTAEGWLYLAVMLDLYSRAVVGWAMSERLTSDVAILALRMALWRRDPQAGLLHHSDRGVQYACGEYQRLLAEHGMICSMSRKGNCWDNSVVESFFHTLKVELIHHRSYMTREQARQDMFEWIEIFYNRQRRHSTLGFRSPTEFESAAKVA